VFLSELPTSATGKVLRAELAKQAAMARDPLRAPPHSSTQSASIQVDLAAIWEDVLGVPVGPHDNFFDLGGYSVAALEMTFRVERRFGRRLPASVLLECPTVASLGALLCEGSDAADWSAIVPIRPSGTKPPVYGIYAEDHVFFYYRLAQVMDAERPFYGIQSLTLRPQPELPERIEDLATEYLAALRRVQPTGPYHLVGHCTGAVLAFEMAQQIVASGGEVGLLAILDSGAPRHRPLALWRLRNEPWAALGRYGRRWLRSLSRGDVRGVAREVRDEIVRPYALERFLAATRAGIRGLDVARLTPRERESRLKRLRLAWETPYVARPYPGRITHVISENYAGIPTKQPRVQRWRELAEGGVDGFVTPGDHFSMFRPPDVLSLARRLDACLAQAEASRGGVSR
jgi:thioesterase domain-containing protein/acyl carrier protein